MCVYFFGKFMYSPRDRFLQPIDSSSRHTLKSVIVVWVQLDIWGVFNNKNSLNRSNPFIKKGNLRLRQDLYYKLYMFLLSNISKTLSVSQFCQVHLYF